jgi:hypothetical protein
MVYFGVVRSNRVQMAKMQRQIDRLEQCVREVAGRGDSVENANGLLAQLSQQSQQTAEASRSLAEIRKLHRQLVDEAIMLPSAVAATEGLVELKDSVLEGAEGTRMASTALADVQQLVQLKDAVLAGAAETEDASQVLAASEELLWRLASAEGLTDDARRVTEEILAMEEELRIRGGDTESAYSALERLLALRDLLEDQSEVGVARSRVEQMLELKDAILARTHNLAEAVETWELATDLQDQFQEVSGSFERIRHRLVEILALEPTIQRAVRSLQPLTELGNLRRLSPTELRQAARIISQQRQTELARKPDAGPADADEFGDGPSHEAY